MVQNVNIKQLKQSFEIIILHYSVIKKVYQEPLHLLRKVKTSQIVNQ